MSILLTFEVSHLKRGTSETESIISYNAPAYLLQDRNLNGLTFGKLFSNFLIIYGIDGN
jgi:hypothetical protein